MAGDHKLLLPYGSGAVVRAPVEAALRAGIRQVGVVVADPDGPIADAVGGLEVDIIANPRSADGISTSIAAAVSWADGRADAILLLLGDEPGVEPMVIARAVHAWREDPAIPLRTRYADRPGHPVILPLTPGTDGPEDAVSGVGAPDGPGLPRGDTGMGPLLTGARTLAIETDGPVDVDDEDAYREALARLRQ